MQDMRKTMSPIKDSVRRLYEAGQKKKQVEAFYQEVRKKEQLLISNFMFSNLGRNENSFDITLDEGEQYYTNHVPLRVTRVRKRSVIWDTEKLRKKLTKEQRKKAVQKSYGINNMEGLTKYLKSCGVNPKKFKTFIEVEETVDEKAVEQMYETGELSREDLDGCYRVEIGEPYMRITELSKGEK